MQRKPGFRNRPSGVEDTNVRAQPGQESEEASNLAIVVDGHFVEEHSVDAKPVEGSAYVGGYGDGVASEVVGMNVHEHVGATSAERVDKAAVWGRPGCAGSVGRIHNHNLGSIGTEAIPVIFLPRTKICRHE